MTRLTLSIGALLLSFVANTQNIGIGITTPRARLHVFNGASGNSSPYSPMVVESNTNTYINLLSPEANETSILFGKPSDAASGGIVYNGINTPNGFQFRTDGNFTKMVITNFGNVGIGTTAPNAPLSFPPYIGKKITLFPGETGDAGFGMRVNLLQIYTNHPNGDIAFGYDQGGVFTERFRMRGNGTLYLNGSAGNAGQVLETNGDGTSPKWANSTNLLNINTNMVSYSGVTLINSTSQIAIPVSYTFTTTSGAKLLITYSFETSTVSCFACGLTQLYLQVQVQGGLVQRFTDDIPNGVHHLVSGSAYFNFFPGTYTITFSASRNGPDINVGYPGFPSHAIFQLIPY